MNVHAILVGIYGAWTLYRLQSLHLRWRLPLLHGRDYFVGKRVKECFYDGPGAAILASYRRWLIAPFLAEMVVLAALIFSGRLFDWFVWLTLGTLVVGETNYLLAVRRALGSVEPFVVKDAAGEQLVASSLAPRELRRYTHPALEIGMAVASVASVGALIWRFGFTAELLPVAIIAYTQIGLLLVKKSLVEWRTPLPAENTDLFLNLREEQRRYLIRVCDWVRLFATFFLAAITVGKLYGPDAARWASVGGLAMWLIWMAWIVRDMRRLLHLASRLRPLKPRRPQPEDVSRVFLYRPDFPRCSYAARAAMR